MKTQLERCKLTFLYLILNYFFFIQYTLSSDDHSGSNDQYTYTDAACVLDFSSFPYQPTGECIGVKEKMKVWDSFSTTLCCRNALTALSQALAEQARYGKGNIFIDEAEWRHCSGFFQPQQSVSVQSCGFDDLFNGSTECSSVSLTSIREEQSYKDASRKCSQFSTSTSSSFDDTCRDCSRAVVEARDRLLDKLNVKKNGREKAICGVAVVISIAASWEFDDHSLVDDFYSCLPALDVMEPGYIKIKSSVAKAVLAILIATVGLVLLIMLMKYVTKSKLDYRKSVKSKEITTWSSLYRFSKEEIENALNNGNGNGNHDQREFLGRGSAGQVYKGVLPSGQVVAIKQIYKTNNSDSFSREVDNLSRVRHPNLVSLFGCCMEDGDQYLVYEYCSAGNLAQHLRRTETLLTWQKRVKILRDCALALRYLHHHIDGCIVHRDIKLTNILLTEKLEPKLSDFGLAKLLGMEESKVFTDVRGTIGYMDPEYMSNAKLTCASDVYSFGIVALQLLSGQKVIELDLDARDQLTRKAKDVSMGKRPLTDFEDPRLKGNFNSVDFESILQIAVLCVASSSKGRPTIDVVFDEMEKAWKNAQIENMKANKEILNSTATSGEVLPV